MKELTKEEKALADKAFIEFIAHYWTLSKAFDMLSSDAADAYFAINGTTTTDYDFSSLKNSTSRSDIGIAVEFMNKYKQKTNKMKPFDLQAAKNGAKVCTCDGRPVRIICYDRKGERPIVALIDKECGDSDILYSFNNGGVCIFNGGESSLCLFLVDNSFDLEAARAGSPVCTSDGVKVRIVCFDRKGVNPIIGLIDIGEAETWISCNSDGFYLINGEIKKLVMK